MEVLLNGDLARQAVQRGLRDVLLRQERWNIEEACVNHDPADLRLDLILRRLVSEFIGDALVDGFPLNGQPEEGGELLWRAVEIGDLEEQSFDIGGGDLGVVDGRRDAVAPAGGDQQRPGRQEHYRTCHDAGGYGGSRGNGRDADENRLSAPLAQIASASRSTPIPSGSTRKYAHFPRCSRVSSPAPARIDR